MSNWLNFAAHDQLWKADVLVLIIRIKGSITHIGQCIYIKTNWLLTKYIGKYKIYNTELFINHNFSTVSQSRSYTMNFLKSALTLSSRLAGDGECSWKIIITIIHVSKCTRYWLVISPTRYISPFKSAYTFTPAWTLIKPTFRLVHADHRQRIHNHKFNPFGLHKEINLFCNIFRPTKIETRLSFFTGLRW